MVAVRGEARAHPLGPLADGERDAAAGQGRALVAHGVEGELGQRAVQLEHVELQALAVADERLDVQVDGQVLGGAQLHLQAAAGRGDRRVHHQRLAVEDALGEDHHAADHRLVARRHEQLHARLRPNLLNPLLRNSSEGDFD